MNTEETKSKINEAIELTQNLQEPYKSIAFEVIFKRLINEGTTTLVPIAKKELAPPNTVISMNANEFLSSLDSSSFLDQFEAIAYYYLHGRQEAVTRPEVLDTLSKARISKPRNISDVIGKCIRRGHIIEASEEKDGQKCYQITPKGEKYIVDKLKQEINK